MLWNDDTQSYDEATSLHSNDCMMLVTATVDWAILAIRNRTADSYLRIIAEDTKRYNRHRPEVLKGCFAFREVLAILDTQKELFDGFEDAFNGRNGRWSAGKAASAISRAIGNIMRAIASKASTLGKVAQTKLHTTYVQASKLPTWVKYVAASGFVGSVYGTSVLAHEFYLKHIAQRKREVYPAPAGFRDSSDPVAIIQKRNAPEEQDIRMQSWCDWVRGNTWVIKLLGSPPLCHLWLTPLQKRSAPMKQVNFTKIREVLPKGGIIGNQVVVLSEADLQQFVSTPAPRANRRRRSFLSFDKREAAGWRPSLVAPSSNSSRFFNQSFQINSVLKAMQPAWDSCLPIYSRFNPPPTKWWHPIIMDTKSADDELDARVANYPRSRPRCARSLTSARGLPKRQINNKRHPSAARGLSGRQNNNNGSASVFRRQLSKRQAPSLQYGSKGILIGPRDRFSDPSASFGGPTWDFALIDPTNKAQRRWRTASLRHMQHATVSCMHHLNFELPDMGLGTKIQAHRVRSCFSPWLPPLPPELADADNSNRLALCRNITDRFDRGNVNCGDHLAGSCASCPCNEHGQFSLGATRDFWCNGDCMWINDHCVPKHGHRRKRQLNVVDALSLIHRPAASQFLVNAATQAVGAISTFFCEMARPPIQSAGPFRVGYNWTLYEEWRAAGGWDQPKYRCKREAADVFSEALALPIPSRRRRSAAFGASDSLGASISERAFKQYARAVGCSVTTRGIACANLSRDALGGKYGCHLVSLVRSDLVSLLGTTASRSRLTVISCEECRQQEVCRSSNAYRTKCTGHKNRLLLSTGTAARQRIAVNLGLLDAGFGCKSALRRRRSTDRAHRRLPAGRRRTDETFHRMFQDASLVLNQPSPDVNPESCLARCGGIPGPCLACGAGFECRHDPFSPFENDYQCLETAPEHDESLADMLFRQQTSVVSAALSGKIINRSGQLGRGTDILGAECYDPWTPLQAVMGTLSSRVVLAAQGYDNSSELLKFMRKAVNGTASADDALNAFMSPVPSYTEMLQWRGNPVKEAAIEVTAEAVSKVMPRLELILLASRAATLRSKNASEEAVASALPPRTLSQPDFQRALAVVDDLRNDHETNCVTKQIIILSYVFSGRRNSTTDPPNLTGIKSLVPCAKFGQLGDVGSALGRQMGWLGCIDSNGSLTSYLNYTAARVREHLLEDAAPVLTDFDTARDNNRARRSAAGLMPTRMLGCWSRCGYAYPDSTSTKPTTRVRRFAVLSALEGVSSILHAHRYDDVDYSNPYDVHVRHVRSVADVIRMRNFCRWAGNWFTQMLGLSIPCVLHDSFHLLFGGDPLYTVMQDTPVNAPQLDVPPPQVTQVFAIPVPIFTPKLRLDKKNLAGHLAPSDVDCKARGLHSTSACYEHLLSRCAWMSLYTANRADFDVFVEVAPQPCEDITTAWFIHRLGSNKSPPAWRTNCANLVSMGLGDALNSGRSMSVRWPARLRKWLQVPLCTYNCRHTFTNVSTFVAAAGAECRNLISVDWNVEAVRRNPQWKFDRTLQPPDFDVTNPETRNAIAHKMAGGYYYANGTRTNHTKSLELVRDWYTEPEWHAVFHSSGASVANPRNVLFILPVALALGSLPSSGSLAGAAILSALTLFPGAAGILATANDIYPPPEASPVAKTITMGQHSSSRKPLVSADWTRSSLALPGCRRRRRSAQDMGFAPQRFSVKEATNAVIYHRDIGNTAAKHRYHNVVVRVPTDPIREGVDLLDQANRHQFSVDHPDNTMPEPFGWHNHLQLPRDTVNLLLRQDKLVKLNNSFTAFSDNVAKSLNEHLTAALRTDNTNPVKYNPWVNSHHVETRSLTAMVGWSVFTVVGNLLMSLLNGQQVRQLQSKFINLSDNVGKGLESVSQMSGTVEALSHAVDAFRKVFFRKNERWDFTLLWEETFADIDSAVSNTMEVVAAAAAQTLHPVLLMQVDAQELALQLAGLRHERNLVPIIDTTAELAHMETTLGVIKDKQTDELTAFQVMTAIPLVAETSQLALFRHVNAPLRLEDGTFVFLYPRIDRVIAVSTKAIEPDERLWTTLSSSELAACRNVRRHFICPDLGALRPPLEDNGAARLQGHDSDICAYALYAGLTSLALSTCARAKVTEDTVVRKVGPFSYVVYVRENTEVHVRCTGKSKEATNEGQSYRINRMAELALPPGCTAKVNGYTMVSEDDRYGDGSDTYYSVTVDGDFTSLIRAQLKAADRTFQRRAAAGSPNVTSAFFDTINSDARSAGAAAHAAAQRVHHDAQHFQTHATAVSGLSVATVVLVVLLPLLGFCVYRNRRAATSHSALFGAPTADCKARTVRKLQEEVDDLQIRLRQFSVIANGAANASETNSRDIRHMQAARPKRNADAARGPFVAAQFKTDNGNAANGAATAKLLPLTYDDPGRPPSYNDSNKPNS